MNITDERVATANERQADAVDRMAKSTLDLHDMQRKLLALQIEQLEASKAAYEKESK